MRYFYPTNKVKKVQKKLRSIKSSSDVNQDNISCDIEVNNNLVFSFEDKNDIDNIIEILFSSGLEKHFGSTSGGSLAPYDIRLLAKRNAIFLNWTYYQTQDSNNKRTFTDISLKEFIKSVIDIYYDELGNFINFLKNSKGYTYSTINIWLLEIKKVITWFCMFRKSNSDEVKIKYKRYNAFLNIISVICKGLKKKMRRESATQHSIDYKVKALKLPAGGLEALRKVVIDESNKTLAQFSNYDFNNNIYIDKSIYNKFMGLLYASLYVFSVQGRLSAIESLKMEHCPQLLSEGLVLSDKFKTKSKFLFQPITVSSISKKLIEIYINHFRSIVTIDWNNDSPLWLNYEGVQESTIYQKVTKFFETNITCHVTTTGIRSLVETETDQLYQDGITTNAELTSIAEINGHSTKTCRVYYVKTNLRQCVQHSRDVLFKTTGIDDRNVFPKNNRIIEETKWGHQHECYNSNTTKNKWSDAELDHLEISILKVTNVYKNQTNLMARCLKLIINDPSAIPIYHKEHILNSARLRAGWKRLQSRQRNEMYLSE
jgi:hypothetical protein